VEELAQKLQAARGGGFFFEEQTPAGGGEKNSPLPDLATPILNIDGQNVLHAQLQPFFWQRPKIVI
jgi:hypothetical protein